MDIKINVIGQTLTAEAGRPELVEGSQNFIKFLFQFDSVIWDDLEVWAAFAQGETSVKRKIMDGAVYLPPEITAGFCYISLLGTNDTTVATTGKYMLALDKNMVTDGAIVSVDGTAGFLLTSTDRENIAAIADKLRSGYFDSLDLAEVAKSGSYRDLLDTPPIPTKTSELINDSRFSSTAVIYSSQQNLNDAHKQQARNNIDAIAADYVDGITGALPDLVTDDKTSLVAAINELAGGESATVEETVAYIRENVIARHATPRTEEG